MIIPGIYRHIKGNMYRVHFIAKHSETLEELVVYEALYNNPDGKYWVRPARMFEEVIERNGVKGPRFTRISD